MTERRIVERTEPIRKVSEQRRRLWSALNDYIRGQGGWVTSPPFGRFVRIESIKDRRCRFNWKRRATVCVTPE